MSVPVSVIICTYNRSSSLMGTLRSLSEQTFPSQLFEILVVDDGSTDDTKRTCKLMQKNLPNIKYISNPKNGGLAHARNLGISIAQGEHILFTDDELAEFRARAPEEIWPVLYPKIGKTIMDEAAAWLEANQ